MILFCRGGGGGGGGGGGEGETIGSTSYEPKLQVCGSNFD